MANILVLDDNEILLEVVKDSIQMTDHTVTATKDSYHIDEILKEQTFDLIITDIIMPDREGFEIIIHLRKNYPKTKVIAMTGKNMGEALDLLEMAQSIGADAALSKPFSPKELISIIDKTLG